MTAERLTPAQRTMRARAAAYALHASVDSTAHTDAARSASPASVSYWEAKVDPTGTLPEGERLRRAEAAKRAYFTNLAAKSSIARTRRRKAS